MLKQCVICADNFDAKRRQKTCSDDCAEALRLKTLREVATEYRRTRSGKAKIKAYEQSKQGKDARRKRQERYREANREKLAVKSLAAYHANKSEAA